MGPETPIPLLMCAACWKIQTMDHEWERESADWVDPTTFMAWARPESANYHIVDAYCDPCLEEMIARERRALAQIFLERSNA